MLLVHALPVGPDALVDDGLRDPGKAQRHQAAEQPAGDSPEQRLCVRVGNWRVDLDQTWEPLFNSFQNGTVLRFPGAQWAPKP